MLQARAGALLLVHLPQREKSATAASPCAWLLLAESPKGPTTPSA